MEENKKKNNNNTLLTHAANVGAFLGIFMVLKFAVTLLSAANSIASVVAMAMLFAVPYILYRMQLSFRDNYCNKIISYKKALLYGTYLFFFASVILGACQYIYYQYINPSFLQEQISVTLQLLKASGAGSAYLSEVQQISQSFTNLQFAIAGVIGNTIVGFLLSLVTSKLVKKEALSN